MGVTTFITIFSSLLAVGISIRCFECNSVKDARCTDITENDTGDLFLKTCDEFEAGFYKDHNPFCRKISIGAEGSQVVTRNCAWILKKNETKDNCISRESEIFCACFTDGCNHSTRTAVFVWLGISTTFLIAMFR